MKRRRREASDTLWGVLEQFWSPERIKNWQAAIFTGPDGQTRDGCHNMLTLESGVHRSWNNGAFALKPLPASSHAETVGRSMRVQFIWQPDCGKYDNAITPRIRLTDEPQGADHDGCNTVSFFWKRMHEIQPGLFKPRKPDDTIRVTTGHIFTFETHDPEKLPLPDRNLLEMQWVLQRVIALRGAAEETDDYDRDNDVVDPVFIEDWRASVAAPKLHFPTPAPAAPSITSH